jgi:hypothetical protein
MAMAFSLYRWLASFSVVARSLTVGRLSSINSERGRFRDNFSDSESCDFLRDVPQD